MRIISERGETFVFDEAKNITYKDGVFVPRSMIEPVYCGNDDNSNPILAGLLIKGLGAIVTLTGKYKTVSDINSI